MIFVVITTTPSVSTSFREYSVCLWKSYLSISISNDLLILTVDCVCTFFVCLYVSISYDHFGYDFITRSRFLSVVCCFQHVALLQMFPPIPKAIFKKIR